jgi:hypothetical protein
MARSSGHTRRRQEFYQLLDRNGVTDDIHLFNEKLREWDGTTTITTVRTEHSTGRLSTNA